MFEEPQKKLPHPWELDPKSVCYYSHTLKSFVDEYGEKTAKAMQTKAEKLLDLGLISYKANGIFKVSPIEGYNTRTYLLTPTGQGESVSDKFSCNCQGYQTKIRKGERPGCSHTLALAMYFKTGHSKKPRPSNQLLAEEVDVSD